jgi:hypothetical protein
MDDKFDFDGRKKTALRRAQLEIWDVLSILVFLLTACIGMYFLLVFINPNISLNLFPPVPSGTVTSTFTVTSLSLSATWTASPTIEVTPTKTPGPTSATEMPFSMSSVTAVRSTFIPHLQDLGCGWFGVGGTVEDVNNSPIVGIVVRLAGTLGGDRIELTTVSGVSPNYGKAGYEFMLGNVPLASNQEIYVQLLDQVDLPLSEKVFLVTSTDCEKNLILVRFKKNR